MGLRRGVNEARDNIGVSEEGIARDVVGPHRRRP